MKNLFLLPSICIGLFFTACTQETFLTQEEDVTEEELFSRAVPSNAVEVSSVSELVPGANYKITGTYTGDLPPQAQGYSPIAIYITGEWEITGDTIPSNITLILQDGGGIIYNKSGGTLIFDRGVSMSINQNCYFGAYGTNVHFSNGGISEYPFVSNYGSINCTNLYLETTTLYNQTTGLVQVRNLTVGESGTCYNFGEFLIGGVAQDMGELH
ncbi:MAG: hypothetical protein LIP08_11270 [Bacteroides sp.]|nr:hypothetical protein [Bacteroides sp.]